MLAIVVKSMLFGFEVTTSHQLCDKGIQQGWAFVDFATLLICHLFMFGLQLDQSKLN